MAPKAKEKAKAKSKVSEASGGVKDKQPTWILALNTERSAAIKTLLGIVEGNDLACSSWQLGPPEFGDGAVVAPFDYEACKKAVKADKGAGTYYAGMPASWLNLYHTNTPSVPVNRKSVKTLRMRYFPGNRWPKDGWPSALEIHVALDSVAFNAEDHMGGLELVSQEEVIEVALESYTALINDDTLDPGVKTKEIKRFALGLRGLPTKFSVIPCGVEGTYVAETKREHIVANKVLLTRTPAQKIYFVMGFKAERESALNTTLSNLKLAQMLKAGIDQAPDSEEFSKTFVDQAVTCFENIISVKEANCWLLAFETLQPGKSPLSEISTLQSVVDRVGSKQPGKMAAVLGLLYHHYRHGHITASEFVNSKLRDYKVSIIESMKLQVELRAYVLDECGKWNVPAAEVQSLKQYCYDMTMYRKIKPFPCWSSIMTTYNPESDKDPDSVRKADPEANIQFTGMWSDRGRTVLEKIDWLVFGNQALRGPIKTAVKNNKNIDDLLEYPSVQDELNQISKASNEKNDSLAQAQSGLDSQRASENASSSQDAKLPAAPPEKPKETNDDQGSLLAGLSGADAGEWVGFADRQWRQYCKILVWKGKGQQAMANSLKETALADQASSGTTMITYNVTLARECRTRPDLRVPALEKTKYFREVRAAVDGLAMLSGNNAIVVGEGGSERPKTLPPGICVFFNLIEMLIL